MNKQFETVECNLCGENDFNEYYSQKDHRYPNTPRDIFYLVRCNKCGLIYLNPRPTKAYLKNFYPDSYFHCRKIKKDQHRYFIRVIARYLNLANRRRERSLQEKKAIVERHCPTSGKILDVGSAAGEFLHAMRKEGWNVLGIEISKDLCDYVLDAYGIQCINHDINNSIIKSSDFDIVSFWSSLEHLYDPKGALELCYRILKCGGKVIVLVPNSHSLEERWLKKLDKNPIDIPRHLYHFNADSIEKLFNICGFKKKEVMHFTLNATDRLTVIINKYLISCISSNNFALKAIGFVLSNLSIILGDTLAYFLGLFGQSHSIVVVGEKIDRKNSKDIIKV